MKGDQGDDEDNVRNDERVDEGINKEVEVLPREQTQV